jgi:hypothetical protein
MILWTTILNRIDKELKPSDDLRFIDIRYLGNWIKNYPKCFPKFVRDNNYTIIFNSELLRYELYEKQTSIS